MKIQKMYEPDDKLINIIGDNYNILQALGCFGINLGLATRPCARFVKIKRWTPTPFWPW